MGVSLEQWGNWLKGGARHVGEGFTQPDDDWQPIAFVCDTQGQTTALMLDPEMFRPGRKEVMFAFLSEEMRRLGADRVGFVISTWMAKAPTKDPEEAMRWAETAGPPSEQPDREEGLVISWGDVTGDHLSMAEITRHPDGPPTLGDWQDMRGDGALVECVRRAVAP